MMLITKSIIEKYLNTYFGWWIYILKHSYNVIFDATNIKYSSIKELKKNIKHWNDINKILYIIDTPIDKAIEQNNARDRAVSNEVIIKQAKVFKSNREKNNKRIWRCKILLKNKPELL